MKIVYWKFFSTVLLKHEVLYPRLFKILFYLAFKILIFVVINMRKKILLLEDDNDTADIIKLIVEEEQFEVILSKVELLQSDIKINNPSVIISDFRLGEILRGDQICRKLKTDIDTSKIPFVLISATNNLPEVALHCGADAYIEKPFDINFFMKVVNEVTNG